MDEHEIFADEEPTGVRRVGSDPASEVVVRAVAEARSCDPTDLPPLHGVVDPDALDALFADTVAGNAREGRLVFEYSGCIVALDGPDVVLVNVDG